MMKKSTILLIAGGWSPEREISLRGARILEKSLVERGHTILFYDLADGFIQLADVAKKADVAFINLHGAPGEDGIVQAFLDKMGCPYQGSNPSGHCLAINKEAAKGIYNSVGLLTSKSFFVASMPSPEKLERLSKGMKYPFFVKSNTGGSSLHLHRVQNQKELETALEEILDANLEALVEEHIVGKEVTCGILGDKALPPVLIVPKTEFFDFTEKYSNNGADEICPAPIGDVMTQKVQALALKAHNALGLSGYSRSDFIMTEKGDMYILETNTIPGMTETSLLPKEAKAMGMEYVELVETLLELAL